MSILRFWKGFLPKRVQTPSMEEQVIACLSPETEQFLLDHREALEKGMPVDEFPAQIEAELITLGLIERKG